MTGLLIDSSSIISLSINCLLRILKRLSDKTSVKFLITDSIKNEIIDRSLKIERFMLSGLRLSKLLNDGVLNMTDVDYFKSKKLLNIANSIYEVSGKAVKIIQKGEAQAMTAALQQGSDTIIIDERITSTLIENPYNLREILESRLHKPVSVNNKSLIKFKALIGNLSIIRSSDLLAIAYEKGLLKEIALRGDDFAMLKSALWGLKFSGCALTADELNEYLTLLK